VIEHPGDLSAHTTWNWLLSDPGRVKAQVQGDVELEGVVSTEIWRALRQHGFRRNRLEPDLLVYFHVGRKRQIVRYTQTNAMQLISNMDMGPTYQVQTSEIKEHTYEHVELRVVLMDAKTREVLWRGILADRYLESFQPHATEVVTELLSHLTPAAVELPAVTGGASD
jgi:hypothetical protein